MQILYSHLRLGSQNNGQINPKSIDFLPHASGEVRTRTGPARLSKTRLPAAGTQTLRHRGRVSKT